MFEKKFPCGKTVYVTEYLVGFDGGHPSNVDHYRQRAEWDCEKDCGQCSLGDEEVANEYHRDFCDSCRKPMGQRLNSQNQITLYREVLEDLGLECGDMVYFNKNAAGRWELEHESDALRELQDAFDEIDN